MTILQGIRWAISAWHQDVKEETIQNCFRRAFGAPLQPEPHINGLLRDIQNGLGQLSVSRIQNIMNIEQFLNAGGERISDDLQNLDNIILAQYGKNGPEPEDDDEAGEEAPRISASDALESLYILRQYLELQMEANQPVMQLLQLLEQSLVKKKLPTQRQSDIRSFFNYSI
ncbi:hypothetical protein BJX63DRAFT_434909 [Aspergillus granulosus]|uniref:Uncharacterized protein n=1 Tax=Aspergillus granulosus TaxID=176169 RepID=A0ABR4H4G2_9EURO